ncbi:MAG: hypothetical protein KDA25_08535, partial [Phycisphaerales bacterium]|nr:hypothetical protein [Phycisphaerales bacterium]
MFVRCFALAAVSIGAAAPSLSAGDCVPEWDPAFGLPGASPGVVFDYATQDFGNGPELFTSGSFTSIGGIAANRIARWNGTSWSALGTGLSSNEGYAIAGYGGDLYAAGYFNLAGDVAGTAKLARWDGRAWHSIGAQLELFSNQLWDLTTWDDGSGEALYIAGNYQDIGGVTGANYIAKWDGTSFSALGAPISGAGVPLIIFKVFVW